MRYPIYFAVLTLCAQAFAGDIGYVTDSITKKLYPLDVQTNILGPGIDVSYGPELVTFTPDASKVLVTNQDGDSVTIIDTTTNKPLKEIKVGRAPKGTAITPDGTKAYVVSQTTHNMHIIDLVKLELIGQPIDLGNETLPRHVAITPDGKTAYITQHGNDTIRKVDLATLALSDIVIPKKDRANGPEGIAIDSKGTFAVVVYEYAGKVGKLDLATGSLVAEYDFGNNMTHPNFVILSPDDKIAYVTTSLPGTITPIDTATFKAKTPIKLEKESPFYIALTSDGTKGFATNPLAKVIIPFTTADGKLQEPIRTLEMPHGIAIKKKP